MGWCIPVQEKQPAIGLFHAAPPYAPPSSFLGAAFLVRDCLALGGAGALPKALALARAMQGGVVGGVKDPHPLRLRLASNLRAIRRARGLSQEGLADLSGLHYTYIGGIERGERNLSIDN